MKGFYRILPRAGLSRAVLFTASHETGNLMRRSSLVLLFVLTTLVIAGCESLPGLQVLLGQDPQANPGAATNQTVSALDLVMADKTGTSDPSLFAAADRIEAASGDVDIIEIRKDGENRLFNVAMLFNPPQGDGSQQAQLAQYESLRRAVELTWQGTMLDSEGTDLLHVSLLQPAGITTLDNGQSFVGIVVADTEIERSAAAEYLAGTRSIATFFDLIAQGTLSYEQPQQQTLYSGQPNHPLFMLAASS